MKPYIVGAVFARGGSKSVPRKNIRPLAGRPLITHAIETAGAAQLLDRVIVSTEDAEITRVAQKAGAEIPFVRPPALAQDDTPEWVVWQHAVRELAELDGRMMDILVSVPTTSPLRMPADIDACVRKLLESNSDVVITVTPTSRSPYFNMVVLENDCVRLALPPPQTIVRRQDGPEIYAMTTVAYAARAEVVLEASSMFSGNVGAVVSPERSSVQSGRQAAMRVHEGVDVVCLSSKHLDAGMKPEVVVQPTAVTKTWPAAWMASCRASVARSASSTGITSSFAL